MAGEKDGDPLADLQDMRTLTADAGQRNIADGDVELPKSLTGKRRLDQTRLSRLALFIWGRGGRGGLWIRHARLNNCRPIPTSAGLCDWSRCRC